MDHLWFSSWDEHLAGELNNRSADLICNRNLGIFQQFSFRIMPGTGGNLSPRINDECNKLCSTTVVRWPLSTSTLCTCPQMLHLAFSRKAIPSLTQQKTNRHLGLRFCLTSITFNQHNAFLRLNFLSPKICIYLFFHSLPFGVFADDTIRYLSTHICE